VIRPLATSIVSLKAERPMSGGTGSVTAVGDGSLEQAAAASSAAVAAVIQMRDMMASEGWGAGPEVALEVVA
jgi:hypothetical protein